jgi:hypothetical protein
MFVIGVSFLLQKEPKTAERHSRIFMAGVYKDRSTVSNPSTHHVKLEEFVGVVTAHSVSFYQALDTFLTVVC